MTRHNTSVSPLDDAACLAYHVRVVVEGLTQDHLAGGLRIEWGKSQTFLGTSGQLAFSMKDYDALFDGLNHLDQAVVLAKSRLHRRFGALETEVFTHGFVVTSGMHYRHQTRPKMLQILHARADAGHPLLSGITLDGVEAMVPLIQALANHVGPDQSLPMSDQGSAHQALQVERYAPGLSSWCCLMPDPGGFWLTRFGQSVVLHSSVRWVAVVHAPML